MHNAEAESTRRRSAATRRRYGDRGNKALDCLCLNRRPDGRGHRRPWSLCLGRSRQMRGKGYPPPPLRVRSLLSIRFLKYASSARGNAHINRCGVSPEVCALFVRQTLHIMSLGATVPGRESLIPSRGARLPSGVRGTAIRCTATLTGVKTCNPCGVQRDCMSARLFV